MFVEVYCGGQTPARGMSTVILETFATKSCRSAPISVVLYVRPCARM
jgi:hypothetical protein